MHRSHEQVLEHEKRECQEALIDAVRAYSRTAKELHSQLIHYQYHHPDEDKVQVLRNALYEANTGVEKLHTISFLSQYLQDYFQHTLPPVRANMTFTRLHKPIQPGGSPPLPLFYTRYYQQPNGKGGAASRNGERPGVCRRAATATPAPARQEVQAGSVGYLVPPAHWRLLWSCQHASSMIGQIDHEAHTNWGGDLHLVLTLPCTDEPIQQDLEGDAPAVLAITTTATWSISLLVPDG